MIIPHLDFINKSNEIISWDLFVFFFYSKFYVFFSIKRGLLSFIEFWFWNYLSSRYVTLFFHHVTQSNIQPTTF